MDVQRYRSGPVSEVKAFVRPSVLAEIGDLVALSGAAPGQVETFTSLATTAALFGNAFLGVLQQGATRGTETTSTACLVYTRGQFMFNLSVPAVAALPIGTLVSAFADQSVATGALIADAIGRTAGPIAIGDTQTLVEIESVVALGGPHAAA